MTTAQNTTFWGILFGLSILSVYAVVDPVRSNCAVLQRFRTGQIQGVCAVGGRCGCGHLQRGRVAGGRVRGEGRDRTCGQTREHTQSDIAAGIGPHELDRINRGRAGAQGTNVVVDPLGRPLALRSTDPTSPPVLLTVTLSLATEPRTTDWLAGEIWTVMPGLAALGPVDVDATRPSLSAAASWVCSWRGEPRQHPPSGWRTQASWQRWRPRRRVGPEQCDRRSGSLRRIGRRRP